MIYICDWYLVIADSKLYLVILPIPHASSWQTDGNRSQKGALTHDKNLSSKPEQQKWPPKVSGTVIAMNRGGGGKVWEREQESLMGKSLQGGPWPAKAWGRHVWDSWEGTGINRAVSHRPERANGLCLSLHLSPTGKSLAFHLGHHVWPGAPSSSSHSPLTLLLNAMCFAVTYL